MSSMKMLSLILGTMGLIITSLLSPMALIWPTMMAQSSLLFLLSTTTLLKKKGAWKWKLLSWKLATDWLSTPLIMLSFWLMPVSLMASIGHLSKKPKTKKQKFIILTLLILTALMMTFSSTKLILFFLGFESTLIPTLFLITRWGMQQERIEAGYYFVFYTLMGSLPLFLSLLTLYKKKGHSSLPLSLMKSENETKKMIPFFCMMAFLVKVPIFSLHLWLPKAHVEAPVAGSMILAAILLKMGGYGFIRLTMLFWTSFEKILSQLLIPFCCWGGALTSVMCLTQTDLKSLIAYSSVSHMSFMIASMSLMTKWSMMGSMMMMMAHGIVSSALFSMAKIFYERKGTRTLKISRGLKKTFSLLPILWLFFSCANLGLPPLPKSMGEVLLLSAIINQSTLKMMPMATGMVFTAIFSLTVYQMLKSGTKFKWKKLPWNIKEREYLMLTMHLLPMICLIIKPKTMSLWPT